MERKWKDRKYNVQDNADVAYQDVIIYCKINKFPAFSFCDLHSKPYGERGLRKHYHLCFDPKLGMGICALRRIPCACVVRTSMLDKPWISCIPSDEK